MNSSYSTLHEGDSIQLNPQKHAIKLACCDCGLVHAIDFVVGHRQKLTIKMKRKNGSTGALRRYRQFLCKKRPSA